MSEEDNIGFFCSQDCAKKAGLRDDYADVSMDKFEGKFVKKRFPELVGDGGESLWVKVQEIEGDKIIGVINNSPVLNVGLSYGDQVTVLKSEINLVFNPNIKGYEYREDLLG